MSQRWVVTVKGCDQVSVLPSESLEIGRKPIRPLPDDGVRRFDVPDSTRSMSKRHALLAVAANGAATVRDMNSTNGTYVVRDDGQLIRLPAGVDFPLPSTAVRMQFGDVPVDFVRVERPVEQPAPSVDDLFGYAVSDVKPEPDATDLSVDDILDLRAGEPTSIFDAGSVSRRANELKNAQSVSFAPRLFGKLTGVSDESENEPLADPVPLTVLPFKPESPRNLFIDAAQAAASSDEMAAVTSQTTSASVASSSDVVPPEQTVPVSVNAAPLAHDDFAAKVDSASASNTVVSNIAPDGEPDAAPDSATESREDGTPQETPSDHDSAGDAASGDVASGGAVPDNTAADQADTSDVTGDVTGDAADNTAGDVSDESDSDGSASEPTSAEDASHDTADATGSADTAAASDTINSSDTAADTNAEPSTGSGQMPVFTPLDTNPAHEEPRFTEPVADAAKPAYTPAFEPGSVFDRVSKGGFAKPEPVVEAGGFTSNEAKRTTDFTTQFEMARHRPLLPFLAMNTALYDDLYAWLAAQGDHDIDAALTDNPGYREYRKAVGK